MDWLLQLEIQITLMLQSLGGWLAAPMQLLSFFGQESFYILIMPALYWCLDAGIGLRLGAMLMLSGTFNGYFKLLFHSPRPYWVDARVAALSSETSFGLPSGHAMNAASVWGLLGIDLKPRWRRALWAAGILAFLIGFSRLYLGVHFLRDVLAGWLLGGLLLWAFIRGSAPLAAWVLRRSLPQQFALALLSSLTLLLLGLACQSVQNGWQLPQEWVRTALAAAPDKPIDPFAIKDFITSAGLWLGLTAGAAWYHARFGRMNNDGSGGQRLLRYVVGMVGVFVIWYGLGAIFPRSTDLLGNTLRYLRYALLGAWVTLLAPLVFMRLGLIAIPDRNAPSHRPRIVL